MSSPSATGSPDTRPGRGRPVAPVETAPRLGSQSPPGVSDAGRRRRGRPRCAPGDARRCCAAARGPRMRSAPVRPVVGKLIEPRSPSAYPGDERRYPVRLQECLQRRELIVCDRAFRQAHHVDAVDLVAGGDQHSVHEIRVESPGGVEVEESVRFVGIAPRGTFDGAEVARAYLQRPGQQQEVDMIGARLGSPQCRPSARRPVPAGRRGRRASRCAGERQRSPERSCDASLAGVRRRRPGLARHHRARARHLDRRVGAGHRDRGGRAGLPAGRDGRRARRWSCPCGPAR